jgi:acetolactate synthase-1/2/3 large subunit
MRPRNNRGTVARRDFFKSAAAAGATLAVSGGPAGAQTPAPSAERPKMTPPPSADAVQTTPPPIEVQTQDSRGSDFMLDVLKSLDIEYVCANTSNTVRGMQESIINYGGNHKPEFLTCTHEEIATAMAHGYFKIEHKPLISMAHGTVGLMHATMALYNAYCDRVPLIFIGGMTSDAAERDWPNSGWHHAAQDAGAIARDFLKWDDQPISLQHFAESAVRGYRVAMTPPMGPVMLMLDSELQERPIPTDNPSGPLHIPKLSIPTPPQGDSGAVAELARLLVNAKSPMIVADLYASSQESVDRLVELAELLQAPVSGGGRMNFPSHHPLSGRPPIGEVDLILALNVQDIYGLTHAFQDKIGNPQLNLASANLKVVSLSVLNSPQRSNFQDFQRFADIDLAISGDPEATMPTLLEAVKRLLTDDLRRNFQQRGAKLAAAKQTSRNAARQSAAYAWDASPISTSRLSMELYEQVKNEDWSFAVNGIGVPTATWKFEKHYQSIGSMGGGGIGYGPPAAVGAALANRKYGRLTVAILGDGDMMYTSGAFWTAAHHRIPLLAVMHNNRSYHQEIMHMQRMGNRRNRGADRARIGCEMTDPNIDFAKLAQSLGCYAEGPITNPNELGPALKRAVAVVKKGEPALVDVVTQPR